MSHLPVVVDPSHACGKSWMVEPLALAAAAVGADGLMVEVHNDPAHAKCDGQQSLTPMQFREMMEKVNHVVEAIGKRGTVGRITRLEPRKEGKRMSEKMPLTLSSWSLGDQCRWEERVRAAKLAGFQGIGLRAESYVDAKGEGLSDQDLLDILSRYDMKVTEVEYIVQWAEERRSYEQQYKEQICFHMCRLFGFLMSTAA